MPWNAACCLGKLLGHRWLLGRRAHRTAIRGDRPDCGGPYSGQHARDPRFRYSHIVHFGASLLLSAILSAPWRTLSSAGIALAVCGAAGVVYAIQVIRHARLTVAYKPDAGDWMWYVVSPLALYSAWTASAILLALNHAWALFAVAAVALLLLFLGIHNAWDSITYIALEHGKAKSRD